MDKRKKNPTMKDNRRIRQTIKLILKLFVLLFLLVFAIGIFYFYNSYGKIIIKLQKEAKEIVRASSEETFRSSQTSLVYDTNGELISTLKGARDVYYIEYKDIPTTVLNMIIVTEDKKFFSQ